MTVRCLVALLSSTLVLVACETASEQAAAPTPRASTPHVGQAGAWPDTRPPTAASCVSLYPAALGENANAFDGTVTAVHVGKYVEDAAARPATVALDVHETFAGPGRHTVTMRTWDFMLPTRPTSVLGLRVLLAAGATLDLKACGYSRPYDARTADLWRRTFVPRGRPFVATVRRVVRGPGFRMVAPPGLGWAWGDVRLGPATLVLADGRRVAVPAGTSGGNGCMEFLTAADYRRVTFEPHVTAAQVRRAGGFYSPCTVIGRLEGTVVMWFHVVGKVWPDHHARIGGIVATTNRTVTTSDGLTWPAAKAIQVLCGRAGTRLQDVMSSPGYPSAVLDVETKQVVRVECSVRID